MRLLVCGGRNFADQAMLERWLDYVHSERHVDVVIQGGARGADALAKVWAWSRSVPVREFRADWSRQGIMAGWMRNQQMLDEGKPDLVLAMPGGPGTADMVRRAKRAGLPVISAAVGALPQL